MCAIASCWIAPPEPPSPIVKSGTPYVLDEVLTRHQRGLGREHRVARGLERVERVGRDRVAAAEQVGVGVARERRALRVLRAAAAAEAVHEPAVPAAVGPTLPLSPGVGSSVQIV